MLTQNQKLFIYWIKERENIRRLKEAGHPAPWSEDEIFQVTYFTNIDREDDKVTKWIRENWRYNSNDPYYDIAMIVARVFNSPETLKAIGQPQGDIDSWFVNAEKILDERRESKMGIYNGAYMVTTNHTKMIKHIYFLEILKKVAKNPRITHNCKTLKEAHEKIMGIRGLASFLAAQVIADLKNTHGHPLKYAQDWWVFSAPGPGSVKGLSWFWDKTVTPKDYDHHILLAWDLIWPELPDSMIAKLCFQNLQNCFCEFDKYMRILNKTGRSKRKYNGLGEK